MCTFWTPLRMSRFRANFARPNLAFFLHAHFGAKTLSAQAREKKVIFFGHFWDIEIFRKWAHPYFFIFQIFLSADKNERMYIGAPAG